MINVLFVCLGNICRSPMAEAVFRHKVKEVGLADNIKVDSAGTGDWHVGNEPHEGTRELLDRYKIDYQGMTARQVTEEDVTMFDYVVAMDANNLGNLHAKAGMNKTGYMSRLLDFHPNQEVADVPDPYFTGNFEEVYRLVDDSCEQLLTFIREREQV